MTEGLDVDFDAGVLWLRLDRPESGNSVTRAVQLGLVEHLHRASGDDSIRVVVLGAAGERHFCTGPDLSDPELRPDPARLVGDASRRLRTGSQAVVAAILDCEKPVVCALNGVAAGVGASMAMACDLIVAAEGAQLIEIFVRRGLAPDGGAAYLLVRKLPMNIAKELVLLGDDLAADRALALGLINRVVPAERLEESVRDLALRLAQGPTRAHAAAKSMLNQALDVDRSTAFAAEASLVELVAGTEDVKEGVDAFLEGREPHYRGR